LIWMSLNNLSALTPANCLTEVGREKKKRRERKDRKVIA
jgi:hypothetical protein